MSVVLERIKQVKIGELPVVVLPLEQYERMKDDLELFGSKYLARKVRLAREEVKKGKTVSLADAKKKLKLF